VPAVVKRKEDPGRANHLAGVELGAFGGAGDRLRQRMRRRIVAELMRRELAIKSCHVLGAGGIPFCRDARLSFRRRGAPAPIGGPRLGIGAAGAI